MATHDFTGTTSGSTHPAVAELICDETANWFGERHPHPDAKESISAEAFTGVLTRVAGRAFNAGRSAADPNHGGADDTPNETILCQINAILAGIDGMANDRDSQFDRESAQWLVVLGRDLVARLLPQADE